MSAFFLIATIIQLFFGLYISLEVWQIGKQTRRAAKSTEDNFQLNLFNTYEQNPAFKRIHEILRLPPDNQRVADLFANEDTDLLDYLKFFDFVASMHSDESLRLETICQIFYEQFDTLRKHNELLEGSIGKKYFHIDFLLRGR